MNNLNLDYQTIINQCLGSKPEFISMNELELCDENKIKADFAIKIGEDIYPCNLKPYGEGYDRQFVSCSVNLCFHYSKQFKQFTRIAFPGPESLYRAENWGGL